MRGTDRPWTQQGCHLSSCRRQSLWVVPCQLDLHIMVNIVLTLCRCDTCKSMNQKGQLDPTRLSLAWRAIKAELSTMPLRVTLFAELSIPPPFTALLGCALPTPDPWSSLHLRSMVSIMLRSSIHKSGSCLSIGICPLRRSTYSTATLRVPSVHSVRSSRFPVLSQRLQSRYYAVAAEETSKGVVSSLACGNNMGKHKAETRWIGP